MLTRTLAIDRKTKSVINEKLEEYFEYEQGEDLDSVVKEVLNDKDVFLFFVTHFKKNQGLYLGFMRYWDDADVRVPYGLILNSGEPFKLGIYHYETLHIGFSSSHPSMTGKILTKSLLCGKPVVWSGPVVSESLPKKTSRGESYDGYPSPEVFVRAVNTALQEPEKYIIEFVE